ncbi:MAG: hypothetical protein DRR08_30265 [Candidatus Parabeggiatoa sp. nov. 2]|nr:MAG: hypothetical protein B6247_08360 [Beggiatoa sp. 4572_84]RKZ50468.1 MAG: hypothetical protein DRR08_30265 [Gammaproteobacteria bacterium]
MNTTQPETLTPETDTQPSLEELLEQSAAEKERMTFSFQDKALIALVPIEDTELIAKISGCIDRANINDALKEQGAIALNDLTKELEL